MKTTWKVFWLHQEDEYGEDYHLGQRPDCNEQSPCSEKCDWSRVEVRE